MRTRELVLGAIDAVAPPRRNGELVFEEPWESRAFFRDPDGHRGEISEARNRD